MCYALSNGWLETKHAHTGWWEAAGLASQNGMETVAAYLTYDDQQHKASKAEADLLAMLATQRRSRSGSSRDDKRRRGRARRRQDNRSRRQQPLAANSTTLR